MDSRFAVIVKITAQPERREQVAQAMSNVIAYAQQSPKTITYALFEDIEDADLLWGVHVYADREAFDVHRASDALDRTHRELKPCLARPFEVVKMSPLGGKGLPDQATPVTSCVRGDARFAVLVRIAAVQGKGREVARIPTPVRDEAEREPGTLTYFLFADEKDSDVLWAFHVYADRQAFESHRTNAVLKQAQLEMKALLKHPYEVHKLAPVAGKGLPG